MHPLRALAGSTNQQHTIKNGVSGTATFVGDEHAALAVMTQPVANTPAQRTRRGAGNWAVVRPHINSIQIVTTRMSPRTTEGAFEAPTNTKFVGTLNGAMKVYVDPMP